MTRSRSLSGIPFYCLAILLGSLMDAGIKYLSADYPISQIVVFRSLFGVVPALVLVVRIGDWKRLRTKRPLAHLLRGLINAGAGLTFFYALGAMPMHDAYVFAFATPLCLLVMSGPLLGEPATGRQWLAVLIGFGGILVAMRPGPSFLETLLSWAAVTALVGTFLYATGIAMVRKLAPTETNEALVIYSSLVMAAAAFAPMLLDGHMPDARGLFWLTIVGLLGGVTGLVLAEAFRRSEVGLLAPFEYTAMIWAVVLGYLIWGDWPTIWLLIGAVIIIAAVRFGTAAAKPA